jgi:hypothetical protein
MGIISNPAGQRFDKVVGADMPKGEDSCQISFVSESAISEMFGMVPAPLTRPFLRCFQAALPIVLWRTIFLRVRPISLFISPIEPRFTSKISATIERYLPSARQQTSRTFHQPSIKPKLAACYFQLNYNVPEAK